MGFKMTGVDKMLRNLDALQRRAQNLSGPVLLEDLYPPEFMMRYTDFHGIDEMVEAFGRPISTLEQLEAVTEEEWTALLTSRTRFKTLTEMKSRATQEYAARRLGFSG